MEPDMDLLKQVRKALRDIRTTLTDPHQKRADIKAVYQIDCLRALLDTPPERREPWSYYAVRVDEEFEE